MFTWDLPKANKRNGVITFYELQFSKNVILNNDFKHDKNISDATRIVFTGLEENMDYTFKVSMFIDLECAIQSCSNGYAWPTDKIARLPAPETSDQVDSEVSLNKESL